MGVGKVGEVGDAGEVELEVWGRRGVGLGGGGAPGRWGMGKVGNGEKWGIGKGGEWRRWGLWEVESKGVGS